MSAGWYLYLLWQDYQMNGGISPNQALSNAKINITKRFSALQAQNPVVAEEKQAIQDAYSLSNDDFKLEIEKALSSPNSKYAQMLSDIDQAAAKLKELSKETPDAVECYNEVTDIIKLLDKIINSAQNDSGITEGSVQQIMNVKHKAEQVRSRVSAQIKLGNNIGEGILKQLGDLQKGVATTVAGYALEEFLSLACLTSNYFGHSKILETVKTTFLNTGAKIKEDILEKDFLNKIKQEIIGLNGAQAKADTVKFFRMDPQQGTGFGELTIIAESAQAKNYTDISNIGLGNQFTEHTLSNLNFQLDSIFDFFPEEYLINAAASLGSNPKESLTHPEILSIIKEHNAQGGITQKQLAENWDQIVKEVSVLSAIDAIAGKGILNSAKYYVIRSKLSKQVKVISSYDIIQKIKTNPTGVLNFEGIKSGQYSRRFLFSDINKEEFIPDNRNTNRLIRSTKAWNEVKGMIMNTKIKIGLNASLWLA